MDNTIEINCPNCNQNVLIPAGKNITFICPYCSNRFEYDGRIKRRIPVYYSWIFVLIFGGLVFWGLHYCNKPKTPPEEVDALNSLFENQTTPQKQTTLDDVYCERNLKLLINAVDIDNQITNDFAVRLASKFPGEYNIAQVCRIYEYIVTNWKYVNDSDKGENFRSASRSINNNLAGDCDDFAILMTALVESIGGDARISFAFNEKDGHAFTEVLAATSTEGMQTITNEIKALYGTDQFRIYSKQDDDGYYWLNLDWFGIPQHPGGKYFDYTKRTIYYPTGNNPRFIIEPKP